MSINPKAEVSELFSNMRQYAEKNAAIRKAAIEKLVGMGSPAIEAIVASLKLNPPHLQTLAIEALGKIKDPRSVKVLITCMERDSLKKEAVEALGEIGSSAAVEALIEAFHDDKPWIRSGVINSLKNIKGGPEIADIFLRALKDTNWEVKKSAAAALGELGVSRAVNPLIDALRDGFVGVRGAAAAALGEIGDRNAVEPLIIALRDKNSDVRGNAAWALSKLDDTGAVDPLIRALKDINWWVRSAAAYSLGEIGDRYAIGPLIGVLKDRDHNVRKNAVEALEKLAGESFDDTKFFSTSCPLFEPIKKLMGITFGEASNKWQSWWKKYAKTSHY
jgi:HEAT repeat protein